MKGKKRWRIGIAIAVIAILAVGVGVALAATKSGGGPITAVKITREADAQTTTSTSYVTLPGSSTTISVPSGQSALILARFAGESYCDGGTTSNYCSVRIMIDGVEAQPAVGFDFAFDTDSASDDWWEAHSIDRSAVVGAGSHTVTVQWAVTDSGTTFRLDDWSLTVERSKK